ncbi:hypothetical protein [Brucella pseudogrignonensis]|uniref:hypothetical protein n=1 Tax=Brucella pseudogrignonensis TaxID=419475 RepID=UPI000CFC71D8|nr:hypothetical protein [Brucella pseudogrignonensis]MQP38652.1 hypothetical protein [Ochrobactrum sp. MYb237]PQZ43269.1 hypothetical protein CQ059_04860 [Brucella pseudogrignonensis]PRA43016.1 hypothetical protein CQ063_01345 [Brucella pseudogrignonensis]PRA72516.1 hypothetical protein CQ055_04235 [Brucella pseudogrignonensis]
MTNAVIGALRVNLGIDTAQFSEGLKSAQGSADKFAAVLKTTFIGVATAAVGALGSLSLIVNQLAGDMDGLKKSADLSGIGIEDFQKWAFAAKSVQIESEKLSDIFKDVNDKVGDFAQTGGGAMKDFFENIAPKVGLTADAFKDLSGPDALQAYYNALEKAGVSQSDMTFYMEAIASDATALIPLLRDGGKAFEELGAKAAIISEEKAASLRGYNDAMRNLAQAIKAVGIAFISAGFVDMLSAIINKFAEWTRAMAGVVQYLPTVAEYAAVAGGALALAFSPAILSAVGSLTLAIGTGLVGAVRLLTVVIAANPLGALAVGIVAAVTAIYHFRDEIQKAIGVDVVAIVKDAANLVINSFQAAFEDIKFIWNNFPNIIGAATVGAANAAIRATNDMVKSAGAIIEKYINKVAGWLNSLDEFFGVKPILGQVDFTSGTGIDEIANPYADQLAKSNEAHRANIESIMSRDTIGAIGEAFKASTPAVTDFSTALGGVSEKLDDIGGGGGGKGGKGGGGGGKIAKVKDNLKSAGSEMERFADGVANSMTNIFQGLIDGSKSVKDVVADLLKQLSSMLMNNAFKALISGGFGGGGGILGGLGSLLGFRANGGPVSSNRPYIVGERGPELMVPSTSGTVIKNSDLMSGRPQQVAVSVSGVFVDDGGVVKAQVTQMGTQAARAGATLAVKQVQSGLPSMIADAQSRKM